MRRLDPPLPTVAERLELYLRLQREGLGLKLLLVHLPAGSSLDDALRVHRHLRQQGRTPCSFLHS